MGEAGQTAAVVANDHWMEQLSWLSQPAVVLLGLVAAVVALRQSNLFMLLELTKFLQEQRFYDARRCVIREIAVASGQWWDDPRLEEKASICCAHYEIVGLNLRFAGRGLSKHFVTHWGISVVMTYEALAGFMERRRTSGSHQYRQYEWLYQQALRRHPKVGRAWPPSSSEEIR